MNRRKFSPSEINHLRQFGKLPEDLNTIGEMPVEYVTGHATFRHLDFVVNASVLIPRLESEDIVDAAIKHLESKGITHPFIADVGTGSGCLGISLSHYLQTHSIPYSLMLSDISPQSLILAQTNATRLLHSTANVFIQQSDLFQHYPNIKFDIIFANLPYIPTSNIPQLPSSVRDYEPKHALDGGPDGAVIINQFLVSLPHYLSSSGIAILEINDTHTLKHFPPHSNLSYQLKTDQFDHNRFLLVYPK